MRIELLSRILRALQTSRVHPELDIRTLSMNKFSFSKKLELLSATPRATPTRLSCTPNFPRASYLDERTLTYEPIVNL